jgi:hypothetical protein
LQTAVLSEKEDENPRNVPMDFTGLLRYLRPYVLEHPDHRQSLEH